MVRNNGVQRRSEKRSAASSPKRVYADALLAEWLLISSYSPEDFGSRFIWPQLGPELKLHFVGHQPQI